MGYSIPIRFCWSSRPPFGTTVRKDFLWGIDWSKAFIFPFSDGAGNNTYDAGYNKYSLSGGDWSWENFNLYTDGDSNSNIPLPLSILSGASEYTMFFKINADEGNYGGVFGQSMGGYWQNTLIENNGNLVWYTRDTLTGVYGTRTSDVSLAFPETNDVIIACTYSASKGYKAIYVNGNVVSSYTGALHPLNTFDAAQIGYDTTENAYSLAGTFYFFYIIPTALNASQVAILSANPYIIYEKMTLFINRGSKVIHRTGMEFFLLT